MKGNEARRIKSCYEMSSTSDLDAWRERTLENKKRFWRSLLLFTALMRLYKYTTLNFQQVYFALRGQDAQTVLMSPGDWQRWWDRQQQLSHTCLFRSISGTGQTCPPIHPQERGGGSEPEQSEQDCLEKILPEIASQLIFVKVFIQVHIAEVVLLLHRKLRMKTSVSVIQRVSWVSVIVSVRS